MISAADIRFVRAERFVIYLRSETLAVTHMAHTRSSCTYILFIPPSELCSVTARYSGVVSG